MTGWIKIHRDIQSHWIFKDPFFRWWSIILFQANHQEKKITLGYKIYAIKIGQCANSIRTWGRLFDCSTKQVEKFFKMIESDNMITREILGKGKQSTTLISISNYDKYQRGVETQKHTLETTQKDTLKTTQKKRDRGTTKEDNNIIIEEDKKDSLFSIDPISIQILNHLNDKKPSQKPFKPTHSNLKDIESRIKEKYKMEDFIAVIDLKVDEWKDSQKMKQYIRPSTMFGEKFGSYLDQTTNTSNDGSNNFQINQGEKAQVL